MDRRTFLGCGPAGILTAAAWAQNQHDFDWRRAREVVAQSREDLTRIARQEEFSQDDRARLERVNRDLSEVDRSLANGRFDRIHLEEAIRQVDPLTRANYVAPRERGRLINDLHELRRIREDWR